MLSKIKLKNVNSYKEESLLETKEKINLIYGLNGSGKTTFANYLENPNENKFSHCTIEGLNKINQKILVYNENFIKENFYESETQKGIFSLASNNKESLNAIEKAEKIKRGLYIDLEDNEKGLKKQLKDIELKITKNRTDLESGIWEITKRYTDTYRTFDDFEFLKGFKGSKEKLCKHLLGISFEEKIEQTIDDLNNELLNFSNNSQDREDIKIIKNEEFTKIEKDELFQKSILGNESNTLSDLILKLKNSDWIKVGLENYVDLDQRKNCPFCQEENLTQTLISNMNNYFDENYTNDIENLNQLKNSYEKLNKDLNIISYEKDFLTDKQKNSMNKNFVIFSKLLSENLNKIDKKINNPSIFIELKSSSDCINNINAFIKSINENTKLFNEKIKNKNKEIEKLIDLFFKNARNNCNNIIEIYSNQENELNKEKENVNKKIEEINISINKQNKIIKENQQKTTNIDTVIEKINTHLLNFGIKEFSIVKNDDKTYKIKRGEEEKTKFQSLSEGEKIVISFLYFVELSNGIENPNHDVKQKIIVIDDPISSLSHVYVFNIAQLIKVNFFNNKNYFPQIFILTHSLYFFRELKRLSEKKTCKLFRILKNKKSFIKKMNSDEIQNDYQAYWSIIRDGDQNDIVIVANIMRNIIEYFFSFIDKAKNLNEIFNRQELDNNKYQSFKRYMNRESHSDVINISDFKEFNHEIFKDAFEKMFKITGYEEHYKKMME